MCRVFMSFLSCSYVPWKQDCDYIVSPETTFRTLEGQKAISPIWQDLVPTTLIAPSYLCSSCRLPLLPLLPGCSLQWREREEMSHNHLPSIFESVKQNSVISSLCLLKALCCFLRDTVIMCEYWIIHCDLTIVATVSAIKCICFS